VGYRVPDQIRDLRQVRNGRGCEGSTSWRAVLAVGLDSHGEGEFLMLLQLDCAGSGGGSSGCLLGCLDSFGRESPDLLDHLWLLTVGQEVLWDLQYDLRA
jgi:hypothetical protein